MAKRAKGSETGMVKVVDPLYDAPSDAQPAALPPPAPSRPSFRQRVRRFFDFLMRLLALVIILKP